MNDESTMQLRHYSSEPFVFDYASTDYDREDFEFGDDGLKPFGFWVSVKGEDDWPAWVQRQGEDFRADSLKHEYVVELHAGANIYYARTPEDIDRFHDKYKVDPWSLSGVPDWIALVDGGVEWDDRNWRSSNPKDWLLSWHKAAEEYDGIIIAPYQWIGRGSSLRDRPLWYYIWDCAGGCIWNFHAIESVRPAP
jgi:hypothetical protein